MLFLPAGKYLILIDAALATPHPGKASRRYGRLGRYVSI